MLLRCKAFSNARGVTKLWYLQMAVSGCTQVPHRLYTDCIQVTHMLYTDCMQVVHMLHTDVHRLYTGCKDAAHRLHTDCTQMLHTGCTHTANKLHTCCNHAAHMHTAVSQVVCASVISPRITHQQMSLYATTLQYRHKSKTHYLSTRL